MTDTLVPAKAASTEVAAPEPRKLDDVLLAMDVVDTLRHRTRVVDMELNAEAREEQLIARLKEIYGAQGIEVPEKILKDGVKALEEQRFTYKPPENTLSVKLAKLYITRGKWAPVAGLLAIILIVGSSVGWFAQRAGAAELRGLPAQITRLSTEGQALAVDPAVDARIAAMERTGLRAVEQKDTGEAKDQVASLRDINDQLASEYDVRIRSGANEDTGFYRTPSSNPAGRNYYLVVEAVAPGGGTVNVPVKDEETQKVERVSRWAQRVSVETFDKAKNEKLGTGIISNDILGHKSRGDLDPKYDVPTPGGAITKW